MWACTEGLRLSALWDNAPSAAIVWEPASVKAKDGLGPASHQNWKRTVVEMGSVSEMPGAAKVLVVEDTEDWRRVLSESFTQAGYFTVTAGDGREALRAFFERQPDLVVLDLALPSMHGTEICRHIKSSSNVPVIVHSGTEAEKEKVLAFQSGADDYIVKGTGLRELIARASASLRRSRAAPDRTARRVFEDAALCIDFESQNVTLHGRLLGLTPIEYRLLSTLAAAPGWTFSAADLMQAVWGPEYQTSGLVKWHIMRLRKKIEEDYRKPGLIVTRWGFGYAYVKQLQQGLEAGAAVPVAA